ncbi:MAG: putative Polysaccharide deacetylase [Deltaproteobacteria bacterium]|nr:putative Polysaccharide deacetylase [Deltaproteobacteria bacterium]
MNPDNRTIRNVFSVDVEEYFQVEAFSGLIRKQDWDNMPRRAGEQIRRTLDLLETYKVRGTFFVLGWMAEKNPALVKSINDAGHEIGSHGFSHKMISHMTKREFREDIRRSKDLLEEITEKEVHGYRAPTFSIMEKTSWAYEILLDEGYRYSSSVYPIYHDRYGWPGFGRDPRKMASNGKGEIWEIPMSVGSLGPLRLPFGGGGYLRIYPLFLTKALFRSLETEGRSTILYMHPWELDRDQPRVRAPFFRRIRHYMGIGKMEGRLAALLGSKKFGTVRQFMEERNAGDNKEPTKYPKGRMDE